MTRIEKGARMRQSTHDYRPGARQYRMGTVVWLGRAKTGRKGWRVAVRADDTGEVEFYSPGVTIHRQWSLVPDGWCWACGDAAAHHDSKQCLDCFDARYLTAD